MTWWVAPEGGGPGGSSRNGPRTHTSDVHDPARAYSGGPDAWFGADFTARAAVVYCTFAQITQTVSSDELTCDDELFLSSAYQL